MQIYIENDVTPYFDFEDTEETIRKCIDTVAADKNIPDFLDVNVMITGPISMREINNYTRGVDSVTDVMSFPYFDYEEPGVFAEELDEDSENIFGDIVICADRVKSQAEEYGHSQKRELAFLIVHSMLHLLGYDHMEEGDGDIMRAEEKRLMEIIGISR